jgi:O-antigen/teichoic acid export membrane protein
MAVLAIPGTGLNHVLAQPLAGLSGLIDPSAVNASNYDSICSGSTYNGRIALRWGQSGTAQPGISSLIHGFIHGPRSSLKTMEESKNLKKQQDKSRSVPKKHVRGSSLLLFGRFLAMALNLLTQILIIRYLSKTDYGMFAYALALVAMLTTMNNFGMDRAVARFVPIYDEKNDLASAAGIVILAVGILIALGGATVILVIGFQGLLAGTLSENPAVIGVLIALVTLAPVTALDNIIEALLSALGKPRIIFLRKYIIGPCLKLAAISLTLFASGNVYMLTMSYMLAGVVGLLLYGLMLKGILREYDLMQYFRPGMFSINFRQIFRFSLPTFVASMAFAVRPVVIVMVIEFFHELSSVAEFRSMIPVARLNGVVLTSFSLLFVPMAARLFAQKNRELIGEMQSHAALWVTVLSFPVFAVCIALAEPLIILLIGERYSSSAPVLAILSIGFYFYSALGLYEGTLRAMGRVQVLLYIEIVSILLLLVVAWELVPDYGVTGAAIAATGTMIIYAFLNCIALWKVTGSNPLPWPYAKVYLIAAACSLGLWFTRSLLGIESTLILMLFVAIASIFVILSGRELLQVAEMFPEVARLPRFIQRVLGVKL